MKSQPVMRTVVTSPRTRGPSGLYDVVAQVFAEVVRVTGVAVQQTLILTEDLLHIERHEDGYLKRVDLWIPVSEEQAQCARVLIEQDPDAKRRQRGKPPRPEPKGPKAQALPRYTNSYRMVGTVVHEGQLCVIARVAESYGWVPTVGPLQGVAQRDVSMMDVTQGLQGLLKTWVRPPLVQVPSVLRAGVCQQAGQQLASHLGLLVYGKMPSVGFPSLLPRDPHTRLTGWHEALERLAVKYEPLAYVLAREIDPGKWAADDPRGDRLVCVDEDWLLFAQSPFPHPQTLNFVKREDVVVYEHGPSGRLYAALPFFEGVPEGSRLHALAQTEELWWWRKRISYFTPLPAWRGKELSARQKVLVVPLEYRRDKGGKRRGRMVDFFSGKGGRKVNWSLVTQKTAADGNPCWEAQFATSREVVPLLRPNVLGIHFGLEPIIWWCLGDKDGNIIDTGTIEGNIILTEALSGSLRLRIEQGKQRWIGGKRFQRELQRRTDIVARGIVDLAAESNANLALEAIAWVDKRGGGADLNRRFSLWNYARLAGRIEWMGLERTLGGEQADPIATVASVSDYLLRLTCPQCGACRGAKQKLDKADTWRAGDVLHCRKCGFAGPVPDDHQARLVFTYGAKRLVDLL